jgi:hypothetical protein
LGWGGEKKILSLLLSDWPVDRPRNWTALVNEPVGAADQKKLEASFVRGRPLGTEVWTMEIAQRLGLQQSLNPPGRPPKPAE